MPLKFTYTDRTSLPDRTRARQICLPPASLTRPPSKSCPIHHPRWKKGGCTVMMPTSMGARIRHTLDRNGELYKHYYRQRTAVERINSQAWPSASSARICAMAQRLPTRTR